MLTTVLGIRSSFGVFFTSIETEFLLSRAATSSMFSVFMIISAAVAISGGWILDRYGPRIVIFLMGVFVALGLVLTSQTSSVWQLFFTYSLLAALGTGAGFTVVTATTSRWFVRKRGLALGIGLSGEGMGTLAIAPLAAYLISSYDWRMTYVVMGLIGGLIICSLSLLLRKSPQEIGLLPDGESPPPNGIAGGNAGIPVQPIGFSLLETIRTRSFWFLWLATLLYTACHFILLTHIVPHVTDAGVSTTTAGMVLALVGGGNIVGRIGMGVVSDRIGRKVSAVSCALLQITVMVWLIWAQDVGTFYLISILAGFAFGGLSNSAIAMLGDTFGVGSLGTIMGAIVVGFSLGAALGPYVGGLIFDVTASYHMAFLIGAVVTIFALLFIAAVRREVSS